VTVTWFGFTSVTKKWRTKRSKYVSMGWEFVSRELVVNSVNIVCFVRSRFCVWFRKCQRHFRNVVSWQGVTCEWNGIQSRKRNFRIKVLICSQHSTVTEVRNGKSGVESRNGQDIFCFFQLILRSIVIDFFLINQSDALIIQIYSVIKLYMFRSSSLPIIRSSLQYIRHW
jgi:hypothetical protein